MGCTGCTGCRIVDDPQTSPSKLLAFAEPRVCGSRAQRGAADHQSRNLRNQAHEKKNGDPQTKIPSEGRRVRTPSFSFDAILKSVAPVLFMACKSLEMRDCL